MRKCFAVVLMILLLMAGSALAEHGRFGLVSNSSTVNLRQSPSSSSDLLWKYNRGTWVQILSESGNWYYVQGPDGRSGWMSRNYVA